MSNLAPHLSFSPSPTALQSKVILVTGAGDGIGKTAALTYASLGATVILLGRTVEKLEGVYDQIVAAGHPQPSIVPMDLAGATAQHYQGLADTINGEYGKLDGVLLNAGILGALCPFAEIKSKEYDNVMQVNVNSQFYLLQALLPLLKHNKTASVIFTSSGVGRVGRAFWGTYSISKFATEGMMQVLADEFKNSGLRFNCINPGATRTDMRAKAYPAEDALLLKTPEDIMATYTYLMADDSMGITGQSLDCQPK
ncbi:YciK family oxidoreductase [Glaciecola sp. XM2]|jgi:NAD(P)-dependent dehydrogenase (short-subunit alcohol dehydrogenase family)|uniref:YciK family oxidoreductase n=1 Tax=Glaciecola sp. XM2 TaxID=1914931 RepID=UPI001BDE19E7|nr:YciK family oxidoreductase [Glaciecola sp. XM2]MBT1451981.1 YciK family oxidoreductase [Glaciecola sp. XM2]